MGRMNIAIPDDLEKQVRKKSIDKFGGKKGSIAMAFEEALRNWVKEDP